MRRNVLKLVNRIRGNFYISKMLTGIGRLCLVVSDKLSKEVKKKIWVNGGVVNYDSIKVRFPRGVGIGFSSNIYWCGVDGFEPYTWGVLKHFIKRSDFFLDVGSNIGFYAVLAKLVNPTIEVIAVEPVPAIYNKNLLFHKANGLDSGVILESGV